MLVQDQTQSNVCSYAVYTNENYIKIKAKTK